MYIYLKFWDYILIINDRQHSNKRFITRSFYQSGRMVNKAKIKDELGHTEKKNNIKLTITLLPIKEK